MFASVARRYDLLNRALTLRRDVAWRRHLAAAVAAAPAGPVLDLATGTGDVALALRGRAVVGADFCLEMLAAAGRKARRRREPLALVGADAMVLPFRAGSFAAVTVAFGVRNFADLGRGVAEIRRVLADDGLLAILELQRPANGALRVGARLWDRHVVRRLGRWVSDDGAAYDYLPASVDTFPDARGLAAVLAGSGFEVIGLKEVSLGVAAVTVARRREDA